MRQLFVGIVWRAKSSPIWKDNRAAPSQINRLRPDRSWMTEQRCWIKRVFARGACQFAAANSIITAPERPDMIASPFAWWDLSLTWLVIIGVAAVFYLGADASRKSKE